VAVARAAGFLMKLARALHTYGMPAHRLELALRQVGDCMGIEGQYIVTPTSIIASIGPQPAPQMHLERVRPGRVNLEKQTELHHLICDVSHRRMTLEEAVALLDSLPTRPPAHGRVATIAAYGLASASTAVFFDGGRPEVLTACAIGLVIGLLVQLAALSRRFAMVLPGAAGLAAVVVAGLAQIPMGPMFAFIPTLAGLIILIPALNLTIAVNELSHGQLVSGTSRLGAAFMAFLQIGFGVALGTKLVNLLVETRTAQPVSLPLWILPLALVVSALGMTVLFKARPRDLPLIFLVAALGFTSSRLAALALGPELGVLIGAWLVGTVGHLAGRWRNDPSAIGIIPGMLLLLPGGLGFRSLSYLLTNDPVTGIQAAFTMLLIVLSLVTGLLLGSLTARSRESF
jgi:uncharacterized membrane protein YjjP (DUF1212 family)